MINGHNDLVAGLELFDIASGDDHPGLVIGANAAVIGQPAIGATDLEGRYSS